MLVTHEYFSSEAHFRFRLRFMAFWGIVKAAKKMKRNVLRLSITVVFAALIFSSFLLPNLIQKRLTLYKGAVHSTINTTGTRLPPSWFTESAGTSWKPQKVLLFSYFRSGSSLTGDIISHYSFEPLIALRNMKGAERTQAHQEVLQAIFQCNFSTRAALYLNHTMLTFRRQGTTKLSRCFQLMHKRSPQTLIHQCIRHAEQACKRYNFKAAKVVRMSMDEVGELMALNPDLAVIYLLRDPRACLWSSITAFHFKHSVHSLRPAASSTCQSISRDVRVFQELFRQYPARMRFLRYEDLAQNPLTISRNIYRFLHLNWSHDVEASIWSQTSSGVSAGPTDNSTTDLLKNVPVFPNTSETYSTVRQNAALTALQWQIHIPVSVFRVIQNECSDVLTLLGYRSPETLKEFEDNLENTTASNYRLAELLGFRGGLN